MSLERAGLIGATGFVGGTLAREHRFARSYSSRNINEIAGETFDTLICAGAPATMWLANNNPDADMANLDTLVGHMAGAKVGRLVLISTIAVLEDASAGFTESSARYVTDKAYGRNRRRLEEQVMGRFNAYVLRLPALFGTGLKKNFVFDIMNPLPSFVALAKFQALETAFSKAERALLHRYYSPDEATGMFKLDRAAVSGSADETPLISVFAAQDFLATNFTNSDSRFQYYGVRNLFGDIKNCLDNDIRVLNVSAEPLRAGDLHHTLTGRDFFNTKPARVNEDMRTEHADAFRASGPYLYDRATTETALRDFVQAERNLVSDEAAV